MEELYSVAERSVDGMTINVYEYLDKHNADTLIATLRRGTNRTRTYHVGPQRRQTRKEAFADLVELTKLGSMLPAPLHVEFSDSHPAHLSLKLSTGEDFDRWVAALDVRDPGSFIAYATWRGWDVTLSTMPFVADEPAPAAPVEVSPERVEEILTEANYHLHHGEIRADDAYLSGLDEFRRVTRKLTEDGGETFSEVELVDGTLIEYVAMRGWKRVKS